MHAPLAGMHQEVFRKNKNRPESIRAAETFRGDFGVRKAYFRTSSNLRLLQAPWRLQPRLPDSVKSHS